MDAQIQRSLGRIEGHLEGIVGDVKELKQSQIETTVRLSSLENWKAGVTGLAGVVAAVVSLFITFVTSGFHLGR